MSVKSSKSIVLAAFIAALMVGGVLLANYVKADSGATTACQNKAACMSCTGNSCSSAQAQSHPIGTLEPCCDADAVKTDPIDASKPCCAVKNAGDCPSSDSCGADSKPECCLEKDCPPDCEEPCCAGACTGAGCASLSCSVATTDGAVGK